jgi:hypothetical protein
VASRSSTMWWSGLTVTSHSPSETGAERRVGEKTSSCPAVHAAYRAARGPSARSRVRWSLTPLTTVNGAPYAGGGHEGQGGPVHVAATKKTRRRTCLQADDCGLSFEEEGALLEEGYCATNQPCSIAVMNGDQQIDGYAATESIYDIGLVVGYQCAGCRRTLVSTETVPVLVKPPTGGA